MGFANSDWTDLVVWLSLPWIELFVIVLYVRDHENSWGKWYDQLLKPRFAAPRAFFRPIGCLCCAVLGIFGFLVQHLGNAMTSAMTVCLALYLVHLACVAVWLVWFFEKRRLWVSTIAAVCSLVSFAIAFASGAFASPWTLFVSLPYGCFISVSALASGMIAHDNPSAGTAQQSPDGNQGAAALRLANEPADQF